MVMAMEPSDEEKEKEDLQILPAAFTMAHDGQLLKFTLKGFPLGAITGRTRLGSKEVNDWEAM